MVNKKTLKNKTQDIPHQIFEKFIKELGETDISPDLIERFKKIILAGDIPSEQSIRKSLSADTQSL